MSEPPPRILIVDDEPDLRSVLRFSLEAERFVVLEASDGEEGLRIACDELPDLIVLDLMLPRMDGYKVCRALKFDDRYRNMPVIILSARSGETDRRLAIELGADAFITKPYDLKDLVSRIRERLRQPRQADAA